MTVDKSLLAGSTTMLVLKLLDGQDMYGYQMIEELSRRSERAFALKTGTLYPLLHTLEQKGISVTRRREMGDDIEGACGQLRRKTLTTLHDPQGEEA